MADNVAITAGSGTTIATDDCGGVHYQQMKLTDGTLNGTTPIPGSANGLYVQGQVAADAAAAGNPLLLGGKTLKWGSALTNMNADGDSVALLADSGGVLWVNPFHPNSWVYQAFYAAAQTDLEVKAAGAAGVRHYITDVVFASSAAANAFFEEGATKVMGTFYLGAAGTTAIHFRTPRILTAATALTVTTSLAGDHSIEVHGFSATP